MRTRALVAACAAVLGPVIVLVSCSTKPALVGPGGECFLATDCEPGLVCVEQANKSRICSDDLSRVAGRGPPEGGAEMDADPDAPEGGPPPDDGGGSDTGVTPDTGSDTGSPPMDSGTG